MQCVSCTIEIPPQWVNAIKTNTCPSCGDKIMTDDIQIFYAELAEAMSQMPNNPNGLAGWILSNYKLQKIGAAEPTKFFSADNKKQVQEEEFDEKRKKFEEFKKKAGIKFDPDEMRNKKNDATRGKFNIVTNPEELLAQEEAMEAEGYSNDMDNEYENLVPMAPANKDAMRFNNQISKSREASRDLSQGGSAGVINRR